MNARTVALSLLGFGALTFTAARAGAASIATDHDAAGALHAGVIVEMNAYPFTSALAFPAEAIALELLGLGAPADGTPLVVACPGGGRYKARWRDQRLHVRYHRCRTETDDLVREDDGPIAIEVDAAGRPVAVRYGGGADGPSFTRRFFRRRGGDLVLENEEASDYVVAGTFMQHIGEVGQLEGDFAYDIRGRRSETTHAVFTDGTPDPITTALVADGLSLRGSQRRQPGPDGLFGTDDDTFDIALRYRAGTLTREHRAPDGDDDLPFTFDGLAITSSERFILGGKTITLDGVVSVAYPAIDDQRCVSGTFRFDTRRPLLDQPPPGFVSPWIVDGELRIDRNVLAQFSSDDQQESLIDVSLDGGPPVRYDGFLFLESAIPCFVEQ